MRTFTRALLTADLQIDEDASTTLPGSTPGMTRRLEDRRDALAWILGVAVREGCDAIVILGDVFDDRHALTLPCLHVFAKFLALAADKGRQVIIVPGNHDSYLRDTSINSVSGFSSANCTVIDEPTTGNGCAWLPWSDPATYALGVRRLAGSAPVLMSHAMVDEAVKHAKGVPAKAFKKFKRVFLGDVHEPRAVGPNIQYVGAPMQFNFGDATGGRGAFVWDRKSDRLAYHFNEASPQFWVFGSAEECLRSQVVRPCDHVRISGSVLPSQRDEIAAKVATLDCATLLGAATVNRSGIHAGMTDADLLTAYLKGKGKFNPKRLRRGLSFLSS